MKLFTVHDAASDTYLRPFSMETIRDAKESFSYVTNEKTQDQDGNPVPKNNYGKFPADYTLMHIGDFSIESGKIEPLESITPVVNASALKKENA